MFKGREVFRALRYPDFFWFWSSYFVSNVGAWMQNVAQGWLLFAITDSPFYLGLFSLLRTVMLFCFFILGGLMADRWDRRLVMIWIQIVSLVTAFILAYRGRVMGVYGLSAAGMREFGGMQAGFLAEWTGAPFAIEAGAVVVLLVAIFYFAPQLRKLPET